MEIIGSVNKSEFLLKASYEEIKRLAGKDLGRAGEYWHQREILSGTRFNIVSAFDQVLRNDRRKKEIESVRATLQAVIVGLDMIEPLLEEPKPAPEPEVRK
jgi:hypothetical protein